MANRLTPAQIRNSFHRIISDVAQDAKPFVKKPGRDFTRRRTCTIDKMLLSIITKENHSLGREVSGYFSFRGGSFPTKSAFVQARQKLKPEAFMHVLYELNRQFPLRQTYKGLHLLGCDGTDSNIPADKNDAATFIPYNSKNGGYYQMHTVVMYDLLEKRYTDAVVQPRREMQEAQACCTMIDRNTIDGDCLYIGDRGFFSFNLLAHVMEAGQFFLIRVKDINGERSPFKYLEMPSDGDCQVQCDFILTRKNGKLCKEHPEKYKHLHPQRRFDFIPAGDKQSTYPISFRLVRIYLDDSIEYLVTNLPEKRFSLKEIKELYHLRWRIETSFLFLKYGMAMNYFHSIRRDLIMQEIYAKLILSNFIALILICVEIPESDTKYKYQVCVSNAIYHCRRFLFGEISSKRLLEILTKNRTPVRLGRKNARKIQSQQLRSLQNRT